MRDDAPNGRARVVIATSNHGKVEEILAILEDLAIDFRATGSLEFPDEGDDYAINALAKARAASRQLGAVAIADDSGLEVDALQGAPGPRSARFGGPELDDAGRLGKLLALLQGEPVRAARFVCIAALVTPEGVECTARGECHGRILAAPRGTSGFGYDPIFEVDGRGRSMAELEPEEKNRISHRAHAFRALSGRLAQLTGDG